jgi:hypothetical protein
MGKIRDMQHMAEKKFGQFPKKVQKGILFLFGAWIFFVLSQMILYGTVSFLHLTLGMLCCVMVYAIRNGGRIACVVYNMVLVVSWLYNLYVLAGTGMLYSYPASVNMINIILFSLATYYLLSKETAVYYKKGKGKFPADVS